MHCIYRGTREYLDLLKEGVTTSIAYSVFAYHELGWSGLKRRNKLDVIKYRVPSPGICPHCGERIPQLYNLSGKYLDDDSDYTWTCRVCHHKNLKPKRTFIRSGDKLKPWSELQRRAKVSRIRKLLPKPDSCQYCDCTTTELISRSGTWIEDLTDYAWVCRKHAVMIKSLIPGSAAAPRIQKLEPFIVTWELAINWFNNTMPGTFEGHSILDKNCAGGRFLTVEPSFFQKVLLS